MQHTNTNRKQHKQHGSNNHLIEIIQHLLVNVGSLWNRNELRLCADAYIIKYDMHIQYTSVYTRRLTQHTHTRPKWSQCMRTCCAHPTAPIPTYQIRPGTNHTTSYSYISYIPSNSFIVYLSANPLIQKICRTVPSGSASGSRGCKCLVGCSK